MFISCYRNCINIHQKCICSKFYLKSTKTMLKNILSFFNVKNGGKRQPKDTACNLVELVTIGEQRNKEGMFGLHYILK